MTVILIAALVCAFIPACLFFVNLRYFQEPLRVHADASLRHVDVLVPARNEAENIELLLRSVLASTGVDVDVWVYDDNSTDGTAQLVSAVAMQDERVHLVSGAALPEGWNGKQHACWKLAQASSAPLLLFLDADVRLETEAIARCVTQQAHSGVDLLSGFPRIVTKTWMEWLLLPMIQFVLLGLLPMWRMRQTTEPAYAAGCGQFMLAERTAYFACGGHAAIRSTRHDGLKLPHLFREHGFRTDICDLTNLAHVRMYRSAVEVWNGLAKNATEGLASPGRIVPITLLLALGQVFPLLYILLVATLLFGTELVMGVGWKISPGPTRYMLAAFLAAPMLSFLPRLVSAWKFKQPLKSALLHPIGVLLLLVLQWYALVRQMIGKPVGWRSRSYSSTTGAQVS